MTGIRSHIDVALVRRRLDGHLVVGGASHDFDAVRMDLLTIASEDERIRLRVSSSFEEFGDGRASAAPGFLVSYTCNVEPSADALARLHSFLVAGGRWVALHATNALLTWSPEGVVCATLRNPFLALLGSSFQAHPPLGSFEVHPVSDNPIVAGIGSFEAVDELYLSDIDPHVEVLMATIFSGLAPGFVRHDWSDDSSLRPIVYLKRVGQGAILQYGLGHRRGHYDAPHRAAYLPAREEGPWKTPAFQTLLKRALSWAARTDSSLERS